MLKVRVKRLLAAIMCFSFIAPMIPEFRPIEAHAYEQSMIYTLFDSAKDNDKVYAEIRIDSIADGVKNGSTVDVQNVINKAMEGKESTDSLPLMLDNDNKDTVSVDIFNGDNMNITPIRVTTFKNSSIDSDIGAVDILGCRGTDSGSELVNISILIVGQAFKGNYAKAYYWSGGDASLNNETAVKEAMSLLLSPSDDNVVVWVNDNIFADTYGAGGAGYMQNAGYGDIINSPTLNHVDDDLKGIFESTIGKDKDDKQVVNVVVNANWSVTTNYKHKLPSYDADKNSESLVEVYSTHVTIGGNDSDSIWFENSSVIGGTNNDSTAFRKYASSVLNAIAHAGSEEEQKQIKGAFTNGNCFICKYIREINNAIPELGSQIENNPAASTVLDIFDDFHMVEHFMYNSLKHLNGGDNTVEREVEFIDASDRNNTKVITVDQVKGIFNTFSDYQKSSLAKVYTNLVTVPSDTSDEYFFDFMYLDDGKVGSFKYDANAGKTDMGADIDEEILKEEVESFNNTEHQMSHTPIDVARYADLLARYCYITSAKYNSDSENGSEIYNGDLSSVGAGMWSIVNGELNTKVDTFSADMVHMPQDVEGLEGSFGYLLNDSVNGNTGESDYAFDRMTMILYGVSYAFLCSARSEFSNEHGYSPENLRAWLNGNKKDNDSIAYSTYFTWLNEAQGLDAFSAAELLVKKDFPSDPGHISMWMFQAIIQLHDLCEHFGIDPKTWDKDIYEYYMIYEDHKELFESLRQNAVFMGFGYNGGNTAQNPLGRLFSIQDRVMSDNWMRGFALSTSYMPMVTNLYDASTYDTVDDGEWMTDYFYRYGFHRKALFISTDPNIVVNSKVGRTSSNGRKVCTLKDLLNYDRDIELYVDTGFYNADDIAEGLGRVDYATIRSMVEQQALQSTQGTEAAEEQQASQSKGADDILKGTIYNRNYVDETLNLDTASLLKDDGVSTYSTDVAQHVTKFGENSDLDTSLYDAYVLSSEAIIGDDSVFDLYQYSALLGYGVVSAIYRDTQMFNTIMAASTADTVVLRSSKNIIMSENSTYKDWLCYFNYLMLGNLEKQMNVNVDSLLDLNAPVFIDIFGNIVTESGYVIIPAACNPTLCGTNWNPYAIGFAAYMNNLNEVILTTDCTPQFLTWITGTEYKTLEAASINGETEVEIDSEGSGLDGVNLDNYQGTGGWFIVDKHNRVILKNVELRSNGLSSIVSWSTLNAHSDVNLRIFYSDAYYNKAKNMYSSKMIMLTTEVLRGAPVETIDYETEGLSNVAKGEAGIVIAYALDNIFEAISSRGSDYVNSMLTMPNLALQPYLKYIIYFGIKLCVLLMVLLLMVNLFKSGIKGNIGFKSVISFVFTTIIVASAIYILPSSIKWSYDNANAKLLSTEACDIVLYDAMRNSEGQEIGITSVEKIDECTELYMEVGKVHVDWQNILTKGILTNEYTSFQDIFDDAMKEDPMANQWGVTNKGSSLYMSTRDIYESTRIVYNANTNTLASKLYTTGNITAVKDTGSSEDPNTYGSRDTGAAVYSFVSPYYAFLDMIIADINDYNQSHDIKSYNFSADKYGGVITYDVASPYLLSDEFLYDGYDILGLYQIMRTQQQKPSNVYIFSAEDITKMSMSEWYDLDLTEEQKIQKIEQVYDYARAFVSDHRAVLKHIPDSMFVKALAFACAVKYNQVFNAPHADSVKMIQVDNRDIMRFMLGDFYTVYSNYPYSFGRFVYKSAGTAGVLLSLILSVIVLVSNVIKPVLIGVMFVLIILNICFRELLLNKPNRGVEGYFIGCGLFIVINLVYALLLKLTMIFANTGYPVVVAIVVAIVVQLLYMAALMFLIWIQLSEWKDLGYGKMHNMMMHLGGIVGRGRYGYGRGYGGYGGYGRGYGGYGYAGMNAGYGYPGRRGFGRRSQRGAYGSYGAYGDYDTPVVDVELSRREERRQRRMNEMRTVDDMYERDEERYDNAFRRRGRR